MTTRRKSMLLSSFRQASLLLVLSLTGCRLSESLAFHQCTVHRNYPSSSRQRLSHPVERRQQQIIRHVTISSARSAAESTSTNINSQPSSEKLCYYKRIDGSWKPRKELKNLKIGERLFATRIPDWSVVWWCWHPFIFPQFHWMCNSSNIIYNFPSFYRDLLEGRTGPKGLWYLLLIT